MVTIGSACMTSEYLYMDILRVLFVLQEASLELVGSLNHPYHKRDGNLFPINGSIELSN